VQFNKVEKEINPTKNKGERVIETSWFKL